MVENHEAVGEVDAHVDAIIDAVASDRRARFAVEAKKHAPYSRELERLRRSWHERAQRGQPLMVAPFISERVLGPA